MDTANIKILLVEDNPGDALLAQAFLAEDLSRQFELLTADQLGAALPLLEQGGIAAVLLDLQLPDGEGLETLTRIHAAAPDIPIVVLSAIEDESLAIKSVQLGAQDFLVKGNINGLLLRRSLYYAIERKHMEERLKHLAHHDVLTGIANRKLFYDRLKNAIPWARRHRTKLALLFLDLVGFKQINDVLGHHAGDLLLQTVAQRLRGCVRETDCVARVGGDEFTVLLMEVHNDQEVASIANKILHALSAPCVLEERQIETHVSMGISLYPNDGEDIETLVRAADTAMYHAKAEVAEKSSYRFYSPVLTARTSRYSEMEERLRGALEQKEFVLYYQPEVDIRSGRIFGVEALLRWHHPERGILPPSQFIAALEETGLIGPVGEWVLHAACAQNKAWQEAGIPPLLISVNVSSRQFKEAYFVQSVAQTLSRTGLEGRWLELEFTEETLWQDEERSVAALRALNDLGVRLTLDNFGSGRTCFQSLKRFPIHAIKIDRSVIQEAAAADSAEAAIAKAAIEVAHVFKIKGLAEGVETAEQLARMRDFSCDDAQGFLYSQPLSLSALTELLNRGQHFSPQPRLETDP